MSLLDEALKKRQQELESPEVPSHLIGLQGNKEVEKTQPKKLFLILLALLVLFSGGLSFAILKYSTSQIRPKVISANSPEKAYKAPSQKVETRLHQLKSRRKRKNRKQTRTLRKRPARMNIRNRNQAKRRQILSRMR